MKSADSGAVLNRGAMVGIPTGNRRMPKGKAPILIVNGEAVRNRGAMVGISRGNRQMPEGKAPILNRERRSRPESQSDGIG